MTVAVLRGCGAQRSPQAVTRRLSDELPRWQQFSKILAANSHMVRVVCTFQAWRGMRSDEYVVVLFMVLHLRGVFRWGGLRRVRWW